MESGRWGEAAAAAPGAPAVPGAALASSAGARVGLRGAPRGEGPRPLGDGVSVLRGANAAPRATGTEARPAARRPCPLRTPACFHGERQSFFFLSL